MVIHVYVELSGMHWTVAHFPRLSGGFLTLSLVLYSRIGLQGNHSSKCMSHIHTRMHAHTQTHGGSLNTITYHLTQNIFYLQTRCMTCVISLPAEHRVN